MATCLLESAMRMSLLCAVVPAVAIGAGSAPPQTLAKQAPPRPAPAAGPME
jgi:hypothetical protein